MDLILTTIYKQLVLHYGASVDDILVSPTLRGEFLLACEQQLGSQFNEETALRRLQNLRKRSKLPLSSDLLTSSQSEARS